MIPWPAVPLSDSTPYLHDLAIRASRVGLTVGELMTQIGLVRDDVFTADLVNRMNERLKDHEADANPLV